MADYLFTHQFDLISPDGKITALLEKKEKELTVAVEIENISPLFRGFYLDKSDLIFNLKSTLAQVGIHSETIGIDLSKKLKKAHLEIKLISIHDFGKKMLELLSPGAYIGKLFASDISRKVRNPDYLVRMFGRFDRMHKPLLSFGSCSKKEELFLEKIEGYCVAFISLKQGKIIPSASLESFLYTLEKMLHYLQLSTRTLLFLHQNWHPNIPLKLHKNEMLLCKTEPLYIRTAFARVAQKLLPAGWQHTSASILQPDTYASGDVYEFFGESLEKIEEVPLEFYTLEPYREYVFFEDRDQLQSSLEKPEKISKAFSTAPEPKKLLATVFIAKGSQMEELKTSDWVTSDPKKHSLPGMLHPSKQSQLVEEYIQQQSATPFLEAMGKNLITSQGVIFTRYFPSPFLKRMFLSSSVHRLLKAIYFQYPSRDFGIYFSHEDRAFLWDLHKFAIQVFWLENSHSPILQYVVKTNKETGMFVPLHLVDTFRKASFFGVYGSNLIEGNFEKELEVLLKGVLNLQREISHPLLGPHIPIALVTGGGPGAMELGNRVAKKVNILSCANIVDFKTNEHSLVPEQSTNPYIDAKMTYRLDRLVERQAEFHLDFPIFLMGGIGMDFEYTLEEVRRKVGAVQPTPVLLFGEPSYWRKKITSRFQCNQQTGTIKGSEWVSNCVFCIQKASQGLEIYRKYFEGKLAIGPNGPTYPDGFFICDQNP